MKKNIGCIIPCYLGGEITIDVVKRCLRNSKYVVLVDDCCPNNTGKKIDKIFSHNQNVFVIYNPQNLGVGGATKKGIKLLQQLGVDIFVKIDADGQINPELIKKIVYPIIIGRSEAVKGNRFKNFDSFLSMPFVRLIGNIALSFINKVSSGYWELFDPTNGFIAFNHSAINKIKLDKVDNGYFFESDLLFQCSLANIYFEEISMASVYLDQVSSLKPLKEIPYFSKKHIENFIKRLFYQYFLRDFNFGTLILISFSISCSLTFLMLIQTYILNSFNLRIFFITKQIPTLFLINIALILIFLFFDYKYGTASRKNPFK